ncbi:acyl transferase [filamentous cyanobacterium LEGE 11480]|uniref:Acetyltransferase n=1 Tax=Romeriopsis navalis LEGE 11480 TaxID=2777977 RepID=A0A928VPE8_9CYAN|nr:acyl transferase [Romeriopsis navalis]MBE9029699.1 acyl transferase [Romeriopsis navalis LEGE 11480]
MTPLSLILSLFPSIVLLVTISATISLVLANALLQAIASLSLLLFALYGLPLLTYRLHQILYPIQPGITYLTGQAYSPWWGSHQIQVIYIILPVLERILQAIPGIFSLWLRLWGAEVGSNVYWTPQIEIADRGLVHIGNNVVFGYQVRLFSHVVKPRKDNLMLYVKPISIGDNAFIGAGCNLGPGATVATDTMLPTKTDLFPNQTVTADATTD